MVDMQKLTHGVLHTKFWVVDQTHFYLGSANMDWRSLTQVCLYPAHIPCLLLNLPYVSLQFSPQLPCSCCSLGFPLVLLAAAQTQSTQSPVLSPDLHCTFLVCIGNPFFTWGTLNTSDNR